MIKSKFKFKNMYNININKYLYRKKIVNNYMYYIANIGNLKNLKFIISFI